MSRVRIGDILLLEAATREDRQDGTRFKRFRHLELSDSSNTLEFETSAAMSSRPQGTEAEAAIFIPVGDINSESSAGSNIDIDLRVGGAVRMWFHVANPLTPTSGGFWFKLRLLQEEHGCRIQFDAPFDKNQIFVRTSSNWWSKSQITSANGRITVGEWLDELPFTPGFKNNQARNSVKNCIVCGDKRGALINAVQGHNIDKAKFSLIAAPINAVGTPLRFRAAAEIFIPRGSKPSSVSTLPFGTDDSLRLLSRPLVCSSDLRMACTSFDGAPDMWRLDWTNIPTESAASPDQISFRTMWQLVARHYALGLRTLNSKSHLSFLPTDVRAITPNDGAWTFRFGLWHSIRKWDYQLESLYTNGTDAVLDMAMANRIDGAPIELKAKLVSDSTDRAPLGAMAPADIDPLIQFAIEPIDSRYNPVNLAGVLLKLGSLLEPSEADATDTPSVLRVTRRDASDLGTPAIDVDLRLSFHSEQPRAVSETPELGFELDNKWLDRERSLVMDLSDQFYSSTVVIRERATHEASRAIEIFVRAVDQTTLSTDVVVIDPSPFRIARVIAESTADAGRDDIVAAFYDDPERAMQWDFSTESGELDLVLPPQVIGEEMIKGKLTILDSSNKVVPVPLLDQLFDYRLSPSTLLRLDRTGVETARATAPWNLRRILGRREGEVGLQLLRGEFELLYGLTARLAEQPDLRVAEREALLGKIPFPSDLIDALYARNPVQQPYAAKIASWIGSLFYHPSELPIFRNWANRGDLIISKGVEFDLRPSRQTSDPFRLEQLHPVDTARDSETVTGQAARDYKRSPLRGGVDFGFESPNVYASVRKNAKVDFPGREQGTLALVKFGALGGSGAQEALFDEGRTLIISTTTQGRLDTLTIVRVGRISMLWNHARHVIVYERTTRTAPRYKFDQPDAFEGLAALRKVKEFIEITQPHRVFPDGAGTARRCGPLTGCFFESITIPVRSQWGNDVPDGFTIPIHGPVPDSLRSFYPTPRVFLEFARAPAKGGKISQLVETPERLVFFSSTLAGEGSNPDRWRARADIDFPVTRRPRSPAVAFLPAFTGARHQPDAQQHDYGQQRFTVDVEPAAEAANLVHGRPLEGIEARIRNVSLARGRPESINDRDSIEARLGAQYGEVEAQIADSLRELASHVNKLAREHDGVAISQIKGLRESGLKLVKDIKKKSQDIHGTLQANSNELGTASDNWKNLQRRWIDDLEGPWEKHLKEGIEQTLEGVLKDAADLLPNTGNGGTDLISDVESRLRTALDVGYVQSRERIERFAFVPQRALESLVSTIDAQRSHLDSFIAGAESTWMFLLSDLEARFSTESPASLEMELHASIRRINSTLNSQMNDVALIVKDALGPLFQDLPIAGGSQGPVRRLVEGLRRIEKAFTEWSDLVDREVIPPFELEVPNWNRLRDELDPGFHKDLIEDEFKTILKDLREPFEAVLTQWQDGLESQLENLENQFEGYKKEISDLIPHGKKRLLEDGRKLLGKLQNDVKSGADDLLKQIDPARDNLLQKVQTELAHNPWLHEVVNPVEDAAAVVNEQVLKRITALESQLGAASSSINDLAREAENTASQAVGSLRNIGERIERVAADQLRKEVKGAENAALELVRSLAEGPVTDTLQSTREWVGYYYDEAKEALDLTRTGALFNDLGASALNGLSTQVPIDRIRDRLMPQLRDFDLSQLLPDFAGLKLEHLFEGVKIPEDPLSEYDWIDLRHGFDKSRLTAWSTVTIDRKFADDLEVFRLEPLGLSVLKPHFDARSRFEAGKNQSLVQSTRGKLAADWVVDLNGEPVLTIENAALEFNESGDLDFNFKPENMKIAPALQFVTDAMSSFFPETDGLTIAPVAPGGIRAELSIPVPDIGTGVFTMTGITIYSHFDLLVAGGFEVGTGLWLSRPDRPFGIAILFLGGGGWFGVDLRYRPPKCVRDPGFDRIVRWRDDSP